MGTSSNPTRSGTGAVRHVVKDRRHLTKDNSDHKGGATPAERWDVGHRIRDVEVASDGAVWMLEDANPDGLFRVTPK